jgi:hypothetical protein
MKKSVGAGLSGARTSVEVGEDCDVSGLLGIKGMGESGAVWKISAFDDPCPISLVTDEVVLVIGERSRLVSEGAGLV